MSLNELVLIRRQPLKDASVDVSVSASVAVSIGNSGGEDSWAYRVDLTDTQAVIGFNKFGTVGIGFLRETDWNTNLPYWVPVPRIVEHIAHNAGDDAISRTAIKAAVTLIRDAIVEDRGRFCTRCRGQHWIEDCEEVKPL